MEDKKEVLVFVTAEHPQFKEFIDRMQEEINCSMEVVENKMPVYELENCGILKGEEFHLPDPALEVGRDGKRLPKHMRKNPMRLNSNRNKKRKKRRRS